MRITRTTVFASIAALAAVRTAVAASHDSHVMKLDLPDGSIARIEYKGDVAPKVTVAPALNVAPVHWFNPFAAAPFTLFDRIAADMDRETDMIVQRVRSLQLQPNAPNGKVDLAAFSALPAGTVSYSFMSTGTAKGMCSRSVQVTSLGPGQQPQVVSNSSGDCRDTRAVSPAAGPSGKTQGVTLTAGRTAGEHAGKLLHTT